MKVALCMYLFINALSDIRSGTIDLRVSLVSVFLFTILQIYFSGTVSILGALAGLLVLLISLVSCGQIGSGDGVVAIVLGWTLGPLPLIRILTAAFMLAAFGGIVLLLVGKEKGKELPFVPFIGLGYLGTVFGVW